MNELAQRPFIKPKTGRPVETTQTRTARRANTLLIKRKSVDEWRIADRAEILGFQRSGGVQTLFADRDPGPFCEGTITNPAIIGEEQRKNSVGDLANEMEGDRSRQSATREGAPPEVSASSGWLVVSAMEGSLKLCLSYQFR
jgi:hypothetical protein